MGQKSLILDKSGISANERPILFSTPMVRAILEGRKGMTRRVMREQPIEDENGYWHLLKNGHRFNLGGHVGKQRDGTSIHPYGIEDLVAKHAPYKPGDLLWVRETWRQQPHEYDAITGEYSDFECQYKADYTVEENACYGRCGGLAPWKWRPSIFMPREAARLFLRVIGVRVERLQTITEEEAQNEGVSDPYEYQPPEYYEQPHIRGMEYHRSAFAGLWDSLNVKRGFRWETNPWVWVYELEKEAQK
ncbi:MULTISPECIES: hypothetical protein [Desulfitobacterium]|uniref:ASCH domain-containing protein n=1 Tax=Desulfitobacterium chlororespirans DSM 11544 TaxID=1121395 RepID=A0A1M7UU28_9FIRM|nr:MULTISPECIES: hypothetical protein [Desulfitobacterium]SHN86469.1 hypothetical protein SAMN02745215_04639 [Desulfitobacterium chlororespirans DSM 11544]